MTCRSLRLNAIDRLQQVRSHILSLVGDGEKVRDTDQTAKFLSLDGRLAQTASSVKSTSAECI
jgi:hypothetical protein